MLVFHFTCIIVWEMKTNMLDLKKTCSYSVHVIPNVIPTHVS